MTQSSGTMIDGYVADSLYPSSFHMAFAPPWTDAILRHRGFAAPRTSRGPFTLVDLGCGDGFGLILNAASHPEARFIGIDAMPEHIARGTALIDRLGLPNVSLRCATFQQALNSIDPDSADYVTAQGVLAWVSEENRQALIALASRILKPGGIFTVGYNAFPGWTPIVAFQRLVRGIAQTLEGSSADRFDGAVALLRKSAIIDASVWAWFDPMAKDLPREYFAHEYLNEHWGPLWSGEVIASLAKHGLDFAGHGQAGRLRDDFALKAAWRSACAALPGAQAREVAADIYMNSWFRVDLYAKGATPLPDPDEARLSAWWAASATPASAEFECRTSAGKISFDNAAAHAIIERLSAGPARLSDVAGMGAADLLNSADALFTSSQIHPVDPSADAFMANAVNEAMPDNINGLAGRHGVAGIPRGEARKISDAAKRRLGVG